VQGHLFGEPMALNQLDFFETAESLAS